jgi:hypothetical protein
MKKIVYFLGAMALMATISSADAPNGLAFLKLSVDVRASGMGETGVVSGDNRSALSFNPALLSQSKRNAVYLSYQKWIVDSNINFLMVQFHSWIDVGFSALSTGVNDIELRDTPSPQPIDYFDSHDLALGVTLSRNLTPDFALGLTAKLLQERIFNEESNGWACDFGASFRVEEKITVGAALSNIGRMSAMAVEKPDLPVIGRMGISYRQSVNPAGNLLFALSGTYIKEEGWKENLGVEWEPVEIVALRVGYLLNYDERSYSAGLGLKYGRFAFDYGYLPFESNLGETQRFAVLIEF